MNITDILVAVVNLALVVLVAVLIPMLKNRIGAENMDSFLRWVEIGVAAAEQIFADTEGEKKKAYVLEYIESKGFEVNAEDVDNAIEAAVNKLHHELYGGAV